MPTDVNFMIGGEAGQGVQSIGFLLAKSFARGGYHVFADQDYESRIRGGHSFFRIRVNDNGAAAPTEAVDILLALNKESIDLHRQELSPRGVIIYDGDKIPELPPDDKLFSVPLSEIAQEKTGSLLMTNTTGLGAALGLVGYDFDILEGLLREFFTKGNAGESNAIVARAGYDYAKSNYRDGLKVNLKALRRSRQMLLSGNDAFSLGALAAGCKFMAAYPMTPSTPIMEYLAEKSREFDLAVVHAEDEIAAVNMAIGASFAGVRAMTATSGSGFCLMVEGLGLAGITETPIVIVDGQRPGPAVGLPTKTEQGDLLFAIHAHHGDFPRAVLAPSTIEDCFWSAVKAFNLADRYQTPVIVLTDHYIATAYATIEPVDLSRVIIDRGLMYAGAPAQYKRHQLTESGVSPRVFPGLSQALAVTDSDEHDENGHLIEDAATRKAQVDKRQRKLAGLKSEIAAPRRYGPVEARTLLIGWGSTYGALCETVDMLKKDGAGVNLLHLNEVYPFPAESVTEAMDKARKVYVVESNATGQMAQLIRTETGKKADSLILKYDGRPFTANIIAAELKKEGI